MWYVENGVFLFKKLLFDEKACPQHNVKFIVFWVEENYNHSSMQQFFKSVEF